jgi:hypothetical protein
VLAHLGKDMIECLQGKTEKWKLNYYAPLQHIVS